MGNNASLPEKLFTAVQKNDVAGFQRLVSTFTSTPAGRDPIERARVLEQRDKSGRTPLLVAASKNHMQILNQLLSLGANVHYINPSRGSAGGALHEAAIRRNEAAVEALLAAGANPFIANAAGRTALDEAVLSGHTGVVRAMEKYAEFSGMVGFKVRTMGGLSSKYKIRWAVLMPYHPFQRDGGPGTHPAPSSASSTSTTTPTTSGGGHSASGGGGPPAGKVRRCLWLYKDKSSVSPRCRLWVDGATMLTAGPAGTEGTLRLHTSHGEPMGDLATTYNHGYCVSIRPSDLTPAAAATYQRLVTLLKGQPPPPGATPGGAPTPQAAPYGFPPAPLPGPAVSLPAIVGPYMPVPLPPPPPPPPVPGGYYPALPPIVIPGASYGVVPPVPVVAPGPGYPHPAAPSSSSSPYAGAPAACPMASPLTLHQQERQAAAAAAATATTAATSAGGGGGSTRPTSAPVVPSAAAVVAAGAGAGAGGQRKGETVLTSGGGVVDGVFIERMAALAGESDEAFAARLASAISATSGQSQQHLFPESAVSAGGMEPFPRPPHPYHPATGPSGTALPQLSPSADLLNFQSDPGNHLGAASSSGPARPAASQPSRPGAAGAAAALDQLDMEAVNRLIASGPGTSAGGVSTGQSTSGPQAPAPPRRCCAAEEEDAPSAPPAEAFGGAGGAAAAAAAAAVPATPPPPSQDADAECVICMSAPKEVGFLHGDTVHRCVCRGCSLHVPVGSPCPLCRRPVERVLGVF